MSGLTQPQPSDHFESQSQDPLLPTMGAKAHPVPVDEIEDFQDPFSDLCLFLSRKIKSEIHLTGSPKKWSTKIQEELLKKILPEFSESFPTYRLGANALKKMWDKVSYFYGTVQKKEGALQEDGQLNIPMMIRENLKTIKEPPTHLPPYTCSHQIALKLSECIATIDGVRPNLDQLTKKIWSVQKHLMQNLSPSNAKIPHEEYDALDKLIVKTLLETTANNTTLSHDDLQTTIADNISQFKHVKKLIKNGEIQSLLSSLLVELMGAESDFELNSFIHRQLCTIPMNTDLSIDAARVEIVQRILALYPVASDLPDIDDDDLLDSLHDVLNFHEEQLESEAEIHIDQSLYIFINAELHIFGHLSLDLIESSILESYSFAKKLPLLEIDQVEKAIWKVINDNEQITTNLSSDLKTLLMSEIGNTYLDNPHQSFRFIVHNTLQFLKKISKLDLKTNLSDRIELWTAQNDMLCRFIHFDPTLPLLEALRMNYKDNAAPNTVIAKVLKETLEKEPNLTPFKKTLEMRLWILFKYLWYHELTPAEASTFDRYKAFLSLVHGKKEAEKLLPKILPLAPL
ncbi:MAG: hypothetical protein SP1CHLAM54_09410 [Chlamydiia bacterium]|nr:hypothetical protein [Chlamydiia bacterium]MCH9615847.1 hypothetical protein [Chlamydiia bacterium]MCH9628750.1 hypothetical protein [Chlamydiia bacterium]